MNNTKLVVGVLMGTVVVLVGMGVLMSRLSAQPVDATVLLGDARHATGSAKARVTVVEFADFQCPGCAQIAPVVEQLVKDNPDQLRVIFRQLPLVQIHSHAMAAAEAAEAAGNEGKFWDMYAVLFSRQQEWAEASDAQSRFAAYGQELSLPAELLTQAMTENAYQVEIDKDIQDSQRLGIDATPTFFVNGVKVAMENLQSTVRAELQK